MNDNSITNFEENGYCIVRQVISEEIRDFVTQYALFDEMNNFKGYGDSQTPNAYFNYGDPAMETLLLMLQKNVEAATNLKLHPTYSYHRVYRNGSYLKPHTDRVECEISITLCLNYKETKDNYCWPIYVEGYKAELYPGDMLVYKGPDLSHWRETLVHDDEDFWHVQGFFHYVNANGIYADRKFDHRESIGMPHKTKYVKRDGYLTYYDSKNFHDVENRLKNKKYIIYTKDE